MSRQPEITGLHFGNPDTLDNWRNAVEVMQEVSHDIMMRSRYQHSIVRYGPGGNIKPITINADVPEVDSVSDKTD